MMYFLLPSVFNFLVGYVLVQQKIVLKVQMNCEKCRTKALKVVADADGN